MVTTIDKLQVLSRIACQLMAGSILVYDVGILSMDAKHAAIAGLSKSAHVRSWSITLVSSSPVNTVLGSMGPRGNGQRCGDWNPWIGFLTGHSSSSCFVCEAKGFLLSTIQGGVVECLV